MDGNLVEHSVKKPRSHADQRSRRRCGIERQWQRTRFSEHVSLFFGFAFQSDVFALEQPGVRLFRGDNIKEEQLEWNGGQAETLAASLNRVQQVAAEIITAIPHTVQSMTTE